MNKDKYDKLLRRYKAWCKQNAGKYQEELAERHNYCKDMQQRLRLSILTPWTRRASMA